MTLADLLAQQAEARKTLQALQKLFPGAFHADGRAIVAAARFPTLTATPPAQPADSITPSNKE